MSSGVSERTRLALLGWLATVAMSLSFITAVQQWRYLIYGALTSLILVGAGLALRALRTPNLLVVLIQLLLMAELLLWGFGEHLIAGLVPTGETWPALDGLITQGIETAQNYPAPAPPDPGLLLQLVFFIALIAVLVDWAIAAGRVPLAGLPLLALYTVPVAALPDGVPFVCFLAGAAAYVGLLTAAERDRLAHWGRLVAHGSVAQRDDVMDTSALRSTGHRIAVLALATSVVVPIFVPTLGASLLDRSGGGTGPGDGDSGLRFNDPMVSLATALRRDREVDLLDVSSDVAPSYLRMVVLDEPGPNAWQSEFTLDEASPIDSILPPPTGLTESVPQTPHSMVIRTTRAFPSNSTWFPVPFNISSISLSGDDWGYMEGEQTILSRVETAMSRVGEVSISYAKPDYAEDQLNNSVSAPAAILEQDATVPDDVPAAVINEARRITSSATTDYQRAVLLQDFFRDPANFSYDVNAGYGYGYQAMVEFLDKRRGFCQHFAATMAMMARTLGIPSRVVVGFLNPTARPDGDGYVFTSHDLHAWPELYFAGSGWVRFEPTPGVGAALPAWAADPDPSFNPSIDPTQSRATEDIIRPSSSQETSEASAAGDKASGGADPTAPSPWWLLAPALVALALAPAMLRRGIRRHRLTRPIDENAAAEAAWLELKDHMRDLRMTWTGSLTPRARLRAITPLLREDEDAIAALRRLALSVERARYAAQALPGARPAADAVLVMDTLDHSVSTRQRLRAWLWPSSLMPDLARGWSALRARFGRRTAPST